MGSANGRRRYIVMSSLIGWAHNQIDRCMQCQCHITMTSQWARWHLKSPASWLFTKLFIQVQIKENIQVLSHWPLWGEFTAWTHNAILLLAWSTMCAGGIVYIHAAWYLTTVYVHVHDIQYLTQPPLDKMAATLQKIFLDAFLWMKSFVFLIKNSLKLGPVDNKSVLVQIMARCCPGHKPLCQNKMTVLFCNKKTPMATFTNMV